MTTGIGKPTLDPALTTLAERLCHAAGTDLPTALTALTSGNPTGIPTALAAGWEATDVIIPIHPTLDLEEPGA
jgi:hypothetical protein